MTSCVGESHSANIMQQHQNLAPLPLKCNIEEMPMAYCRNMMVDDKSLYDCGSKMIHHVDDEDLGLLPPEGSAKFLSVSQNIVTLIEKNQIFEESTANFEDSCFCSPPMKFRERLPTRTSPNSNFLPSKYEIDQLQHNPNHNDDKAPLQDFRSFHSFSSESMESMDDYLDLFEIESSENDAQVPKNLNSLISGNIKAVATTPEIKRPVTKRSVSMFDASMNQVRNSYFEALTPDVYRDVHRLTKTSSHTPKYNERYFKRPDPPSTMISSNCKRMKCDSDEKENQPVQAPCGLKSTTTRPILRKSMSMNDANIKIALARSTSDSDMIGDYSKPCCLPLTPGRHHDLKSISCETMAKLLRGEFGKTVASFKIIDCRYPYEYDGGHIRGAQNLYTYEQILDELVNCKTETPIVQAEEPKRHIIVFHCEFSSERGPKLSRFLRKHDRARNTNAYPALHYPEIYLLHGGYKEFFANYSELCYPVSYRPMLHPSFSAAYKQFRAKSRSWNGDNKGNLVKQRSLKSRSRLNL